MDANSFTHPGADARADCCSARASYRVVLPPTPERAEPADLYLCGHHQRECRPALEARGAALQDLDELLLFSAGV